ncbi:MAG: ferrous iron transport protein A [Verrucomicrobia bacterium]|nr:ferrous iron transport protein A [Verrucomicrobiota bacterium]
MAAVLIKLSELPVGGRAVVREFPAKDPAFLRMREMGLLVGTTLTLIRTAPLGDPLEIKLRGYHLTIRKVDAARILVEPLA